MPYEMKLYQEKFRSDQHEIQELSKQSQALTDERAKTLGNIVGRVIRQHQLINMTKRKELTVVNGFDILSDNMEDVTADDVIGLDKDIAGFVKTFPENLQPKAKELCESLKNNFEDSSKELKRLSEYIYDISVNGSLNAQSPRLSSWKEQGVKIGQVKDQEPSTKDNVSILSKIGMLFFGSKPNADTKLNKAVEINQKKISMSA